MAEQMDIELEALRKRVAELEAALRVVADEHGYGLPPETMAMIRNALKEAP